MKIARFISHLFSPGETNNYKARSLHIDFLALYLMGAILLAFTAKGFVPYFNNVLGFATDITVDKLYELTNGERQKTRSLRCNTTRSLRKRRKRKRRTCSRKTTGPTLRLTGPAPGTSSTGADTGMNTRAKTLPRISCFRKGWLTPG